MPGTTCTAECACRREPGQHYVPTVMKVESKLIKKKRPPRGTIAHLYLGPTRVPWCEYLEDTRNTQEIRMVRPATHTKQAVNPETRFKFRHPWGAQSCCCCNPRNRRMDPQRQDPSPSLTSTVARVLVHTRSVEVQSQSKIPILNQQFLKTFPLCQIGLTGPCTLPTTSAAASPVSPRAVAGCRGCHA